MRYVLSIIISLVTAGSSRGQSDFWEEVPGPTVRDFVAVDTSILGLSETGALLISDDSGSAWRQVLGGWVKHIGRLGDGRAAVSSLQDGQVSVWLVDAAGALTEVPAPIGSDDSLSDLIEMNSSGESAWFIRSGTDVWKSHNPEEGWEAVLTAMDGRNFVQLVPMPGEALWLVRQKTQNALPVTVLESVDFGRSWQEIGLQFPTVFGWAASEDVVTLALPDMVLYTEGSDPARLFVSKGIGRGALLHHTPHGIVALKSEHLVDGHIVYHGELSVSYDNARTFAPLGWPDAPADGPRRSMLLAPDGHLLLKMHGRPLVRSTRPLSDPH